LIDDAGLLAPLRRHYRQIAVAAGAVALVLIALAVAPFPVRSAATRPEHTRLVRGAVRGLSVPAPIRPAFTPSNPSPLSVSSTVARWAPVVRPVVARAKPTRRSRAIATVPTRTPEGTSNIVLVLGRAANRADGLWVRVRLAVLPNNTVAWVPREAVGGYRFVQTHLVIRLDRFTATLYRGERVVFRAEIGVGTRTSPTPTGTFYIRNKLTEFSAPFYGPIAFGTSARSSTLTDWPSGGFIGIHGTDQPNLLPGRVSHGCIRMRNADILRLARLMPVGTPITIRA
jgi:hypothetical protein